LYKPTLSNHKNSVIIVEDGVYKPSHIQLKAWQAQSIQFLRKDQSPCAAMLLIPQLEINEELPLNKIITIQLPAVDPGEYQFHCQMQMYKGSLLVK